MRTVSVLGAEKREVIARLLAEAADIHAAKLTEHLLCMPLRDRLIVNDKTLMVNVGTMQGLKYNHLAVAKGLDNPMTFKILRVAEAGEIWLFWTPLDSSTDLAQLAGTQVTFLEFKSMSIKSVKKRYAGMLSGVPMSPCFVLRGQLLRTNCGSGI